MLREGGSTGTDLDSLTPSSEAVMEVHHPATGQVLLQDDGAPVTITLAGQDSPRFRRAAARVMDRRLESMSAVRGFRAGGRRVVAESIERMAAATVAWSGIRLDGAEPPCSPEAAGAVYVACPWLREQAEAFVNDRQNFMPATVAV